MQSVESTALACLALAIVGCSRTPPSSDPPGRAAPSAALSAAPSASVGSAPTFPPLGPRREPARTEDGVPVLPITLAASEREGQVRFVRAMSKTLEWTSSQASDGARIWAGISRDGPDVIVRDGVVSEGVLRRLGVAKAGCAAARDGELVLSGTAPTGEQQHVVSVDGKTGQRTSQLEPARGQVVFRVRASGEVERQSLPPTVASDDECRLWLEPDGRYALATFGIVTWNGREFSEDRSFFSGRTTLGSVDGPRFCFRFCNAVEREKSHPATRDIVQQVGENATFVAHEGWVGAVTKGRAVRWKDGLLEVLGSVADSAMLNGKHDAVFTERGDLVIGFEYHFARYAVWRAGAKALSPERTLATGDVLSSASPTVIVRGLGGSIPKSNTFAVLVGQPIGYGTGGSTLGYSDLRRSAEAYRAQADRARAVLGPGELWVTHEAVLEPKCGAHVRSPVGWEAMELHDFGPPSLPKLSPLAVTRKPACLPLSSAAALPGDPDLLLAISGGDLYAAWLPAPLPLPRGSHFGRKLDDRPVVQRPKPGAGWKKLGAASALSGQDATAAPAIGPGIARGTWQAAGALLVRAGRQEIALTRLGAALLPANTRAMAVGTGSRFRLWGALGHKLVDCSDQCRVLEPGVASDIVAVVPRTDTALLLGFADGRIGVYEVPATGGELVGTHALVEALVRHLRSRPSE